MTGRRCAPAEARQLHGQAGGRKTSQPGVLAGETKRAQNGCDRAPPLSRAAYPATEAPAARATLRRITRLARSRRRWPSSVACARLAARLRLRTALAAPHGVVVGGGDTTGGASVAAGSGCAFAGRSLALDNSTSGGGCFTIAASASKKSPLGSLAIVCRRIVGMSRARVPGVQWWRVAVRKLKLIDCDGTKFTRATSLFV